MGSSSSKKKGGSYPKQDMGDGGYPAQQQQMPYGQGDIPPQHDFPNQGYPGQQPMGYPGQQQMGYPGEEQMGYPGQQPMGYPGDGPMGYPPHQQGPYPNQYGEHAGPVLDDVGREHSACQYQFKPGEETYRCLDCEITEDVPSEFKALISYNHRQCKFYTIVKISSFKRYKDI